jgi:hypothetical protein
MAYGENHDHNIGTSYCTIHAEEHALNKLPYVQPRKKKQRLDILVIRTTHTGSLGISKPCIRCTMLLEKELPSKGYILGNIYYTMSNDTIIKTNIEELVMQHSISPHLSLYYRIRQEKRDLKIIKS